MELAARPIRGIGSPRFADAEGTPSVPSATPSRRERSRPDLRTPPTPVEDAECWHDGVVPSSVYAGCSSGSVESENAASSLNLKRILLQDMGVSILYS